MGLWWMWHGRVAVKRGGWARDSRRAIVVLQGEIGRVRWLTRHHCPSPQRDRSRGARNRRIESGKARRRYKWARVSHVAKLATHVPHLDVTATTHSRNFLPRATTTHRPISLHPHMRPFFLKGLPYVRSLAKWHFVKPCDRCSDHTCNHRMSGEPSCTRTELHSASSTNLSIMGAVTIRQPRYCQAHHVVWRCRRRAVRCRMEWPTGNYTSCVSGCDTPVFQPRNVCEAWAEGRANKCGGRNDCVSPCRHSFCGPVNFSLHSQIRMTLSQPSPLHSPISTSPSLNGSVGAAGCRPLKTVAVSKVSESIFLVSPSDASACSSRHGRVTAQYSSLLRQ